MKKLLFTILAIIAGLAYSRAQQVPKAVVVEYFTNTYCSVCAGRNPGFHGNLEDFPSVILVSYHPSIPYPACPLNQHNKPENDAKTSFYGLLNGTPQMAILGEVIPVNEDYSNPTLFSSRMNETSSFSMTTTMEPSGPDSVIVSVIIKKEDTSSLMSFDLYAAIVEDTLNFAAHNGETIHHDVFRKSAFGPLPVQVNAPLSIGDTIVHTKICALSTVWNRSQCYAASMISTPDKKIVQAAKSLRLQPATTGINGVETVSSYRVYPSPAGDRLYIRGVFTTKTMGRITNMAGKVVLETGLGEQSNSIHLKALPAGTYLLEIISAKGRDVMKFDHF
ncbi:MAG: T9SS type A sorting domain-containing protein [Taibaiella sp.]|jgi:hypothetical protein